MVGWLGSQTTSFHRGPNQPFLWKMEGLRWSWEIFLYMRAKYIDLVYGMSLQQIMSLSLTSRNLVLGEYQLRGSLYIFWIRSVAEKKGRVLGFSLLPESFFTVSKSGKIWVDQILELGGGHCITPWHEFLSSTFNLTIKVAISIKEGFLSKGVWGGSSPTTGEAILQYSSKVGLVVTRVIPRVVPRLYTSGGGLA